jgi:hypothetical protein
VRFGSTKSGPITKKYETESIVTKLPGVSGRECIGALERPASASSGKKEVTSSCGVTILSPRLPCLSTKNSTGAR